VKGLKAAGQEGDGLEREGLEAWGAAILGPMPGGARSRLWRVAVAPRLSTGRRRGLATCGSTWAFARDAAGCAAHAAAEMVACWRAEPARGRMMARRLRLIVT